jgi:hypothetical protein
MVSLLIVGLGTLGNALLTTLRYAEINKVFLMDGDIVEDKNITNQPLFLKQDVGKNKAKALAYRLNKIANIFVPISEYLYSLSQLEEINPDYVVDCTDSVAAKEIVNNYLLKYNKIGVIASVAEQRGFALRPSSEGVCFNCLLANSEIINRNCAAASLPIALKLAAEIQPLFSAEYNFVEVSLSQVKRLKLNRAKNCSLINTEFYQLCGSTIKLLKPVDISKIDLSKFMDFGDFWKYSSQGKEIIITKEGFVLAHNMSLEELNKELNNMLNHN